MADRPPQRPNTLSINPYDRNYYKNLYEHCSREGQHPISSNFVSSTRWTIGDGIYYSNQIQLGSRNSEIQNSNISSSEDDSGSNQSLRRN